MADTVRPTKKQRQLLDFIEVFIAEHGYSPSYREIMTGCHYTSVATVALHISSLIKRGHLRKRDHSARSLEVVKQSAVPETFDGDAAPMRDRLVEVPETLHEDWLLRRAESYVAERGTAADVGVLEEALQMLGLSGRVRSLRDKLPPT